MKTLSELWLANGEKPGLKVIRNDWDKHEYFVIMGKAPVNGFYGYVDTGSAYEWDCDLEKWSLYEEPKPKLKAWLFRVINYNEPTYRLEFLLNDPTEYEIKKCDYKRAEGLDKLVEGL